MKTGASNADIVKIEKLAKQKVPSAKISKILGIQKKVVESFLPKAASKKDDK